MKKTMRVTTVHDPASLHLDLVNAGVPVLTIRSEFASTDRDVPLLSVIVFADGYDPDDPTEQTKIITKIAESANNDKVKNKSIPPDPVGFDREASFIKQEKVD